MTPEVITSEEIRLNGLLKSVHEEIRAYGESAQEMLQYVISFSELVKNASLYFQHALDSERRDIATQVFYELVIKNKNVEDYRGKDGFEALLGRVRLSGSQTSPLFLRCSQTMSICEASLKDCNT
jgi:hypothetical protein